MQYIKPILAEASPNLYNAAKSANLSLQEANQINDMASSIKQHRELSKLDINSARREYDRLDPGVQQQLKFMFKTAEYMQEAPDFSDRVKGVLGGALKVAASPLIGLFKLGGQYNRLINEPYLVARSVAQGADPFAAKTWRDAWDGKNEYDQGALKEATTYFGKYDVMVAQGLLQGKTPGEIVQDYGKADKEIMLSIQKAYNEPELFQEVMDSVKYAQVSPGRDIARMLDRKPVSAGVSGTTKNVSGILDFVYQFAIDPLTWLTGGLSKGVTKGERLANSITDQMNNGVSAERAVGDAFKDRKLYEFWEYGLGPALKKHSLAKTKEERSFAFDEIAKNFPGYNERGAIKALTTKDSHMPEGVVDAKSAQKYFENAGNLQLLLSGRVDGVTYMRNGVAVARTGRLYTQGLMGYLDGVFNATSRTTFTGKARETASEVTEALNPIDDLLRQADTAERLLIKDLDTTVLDNAVAEIKGWKRIGQQAARSAAGLEVRIGDGQAIKTAANFTARARQILPKDMALALTERFIDSTADVQIVILRNLDAATMYAMGLGGDNKGLEVMKKILQDKYGSLAGFATKEVLQVHPDHAKVMPDYILKNSNDGAYLDTIGPLQPYQSTRAVGSLPYDLIGSTIWDIKSKKNIINAVGGATQGQFSKKLVDTWSILTLFPRLGVRSAIDEAVMYLLSAPTKDLRAFASREGYKMANVTKTFTGSKSGTGPVKAAIQKAFKLTDQSERSVRLGKKLHINDEDMLSILERERILQAKAEELGTDVVYLKSLEKRQAIATHVENIYGQYLDKEGLDDLMDAFVHSPDALNSAAQSIVAHSGLSGNFGDEVMGAMITPTMIDLAFEAIGAKKGKFLQTIDTAMLSEQEVALAHFEKWFKMLAGNKFKLKKDGKDVTVLNPADIFFRNGALKPGGIVPNGVSKIDGGELSLMENAINTSMENIGFKYNDSTKLWEVTDQYQVDAFKALSSHTVNAKAQGQDDAGIVLGQLARMFADMYVTFHGDAKNFNEGLINLVQKSYSDLVKLGKDTGRIPSWNQAVARISLDQFQEASQGFRIRGRINTDLEFGNFDTESVFRRYGNQMMDMMDKQVTGIFRQPAVMVTYAQLRKKYRGIEREYARQEFARRVGVWEQTLADGAKSNEWRQAQDIAKRRFTEIAVREAADTVLKFADNPAIRSNFSFSLRTVGRYYRATEDFYRRLYRMKDVSPRVLYRMRLAHLGIEASGSIHNDANGEPYVVMPTDNIIFKATNGTLAMLMGKGFTGYHQPSFNEFTFKLRMVNPSFSQDSGLPTLSGPVAGLSIIGVKGFLGTVPGKLPFIGGIIDPYAKRLAEATDTFALGNIGDNIDVTRAIVPASLQRVWAILDPTEKSRQEVTAAQQAMAYMAANGKPGEGFLDPNSTDEEKAAYLKNLRIAAHNVLAMRNFLGLFSPVAPTTMESKGIPDYLKNVGITGLRPEFFDILNGITLTQGEDVQDPYELAMATFIGKNPGKLIYTVSREDKQTSVLVKNTEQLKAWGIKNQNLIKQYGEAAWIFAPQVGTFNAATYNWIQAAGLTKSKSLEKYYTDLLVAQDKQRYYDIQKQEKETLAQMSDPELRAQVINAATDERFALKASNPLLNSALIGQGNTIGNETVLLNSVQQIISNPNTDVEPGTRQRMGTAIKLVRDFIAFANDPELKNMTNFTQIKAERKMQLQTNLKELMLGDLYVTEANRAIFDSILNFYSRDSYYAYKELM